MSTSEMFHYCLLAWLLHMPCLRLTCFLVVWMEKWKFFSCGIFFASLKFSFFHPRFFLIPLIFFCVWACASFMLCAERNFSFIVRFCAADANAFFLRWNENNMKFWEMSWIWASIWDQIVLYWKFSVQGWV